jgi:7-cyano-7-deazaguanine synthase
MTPDTQKKAVILLSGGLDSATVLAVARDAGFRCYALSFVYGQRHQHEVEAAREIAARLGAEEHRVATIDLAAFGGSALTDDALAVPKPADANAVDEQEGVPITYVPARNTIFLSFALGWAEVLGAQDIFIGANALDFSGYPDCRPEYLDAFEKMANLATAAGVSGKKLTIHAPFLQMTKAETIQIGTRLGVPYELTRSCYDPAEDGAACGRCDACLLRLRGFKKAGLIDPAPYVAGV